MFISCSGLSREQTVGPSLYPTQAFGNDFTSVTPKGIWGWPQLGEGVALGECFQGTFHGLVSVWSNSLLFVCHWSEPGAVAATNCKEGWRT